MKATIKSGALLLLAVIAFYWKILFTRQFSLLTDAEAVRQHYGWLQFWITSVRNGIAPLWDPYMFAGRSFPGEMQTAAFYPLHLLLAAFPLNHQNLFAPHVYELYFVITHLMAACFMFALVREFGLSPYAAVVSSLCFSLGGFVGKVWWPHLLESSVWLPLLFLLLLRSLKAASILRGMRYATFAALVLGLSILAGGLHIVMMQVIVMAAAGALYTFTSEECADAPPLRLRLRLRQTLAVLFVICALGLAAGAIQLLPSVEYARLADRWVLGAVVPGAQRIPYANLSDPISPQGVAGYLFPFGFEGKLGPGEVLNPYIGVFPLLLAIIGTWKRWSDVWVRFAAGLVIASILFSMGKFSLVHGLAYVTVPLLWMSRVASRFLYIAHFGLAILAAYGTETIFAGNFSFASLGRAFKWLAIGSAGVLLVSAAVGKPGLSNWTALSFVMIFLSYGLYRYVAAGSNGLWAKLLVVALILFDLSAFDETAVNKIEAAQIDHENLDRLLSMQGVAQFFRSQPAHAFRVQFSTIPPLNPGDAFALETVNGGAVTMVKNYHALQDNERGLKLLNVRYVVKAASAPNPSPENAPVYADANWKVYQDSQAYPRAWIVHRTVVDPSPEVAFRHATDPGADPRTVAWLSGPLPANPQPAPDQTAGEAAIESYSPNRVVLKTQAGSRGLLVLSEMYYPGWKASVNGSEAQIYEVDGGLRGVSIPAGSSHVVFQYAPRSVFWGAAVSLLAFLSGPVIVFLCTRQHGNG